MSACDRAYHERLVADPVAWRRDTVLAGPQDMGDGTYRELRTCRRCHSSILGPELTALPESPVPILCRFGSLA